MEVGASLGAMAGPGGVLVGGVLGALGGGLVSGLVNRFVIERK